MTLAAVTRAACTERLAVLGGFHARPDDGLPDGIRTLILLGPAEPGFWPHVQTTPEFQDGAPDPIDRWSARVIGVMADTLGAQPFFPFGGPPFRPFIAWAHRSGRAWASEVGILVHDTQGLLVSYRGALGFAESLELPPTPDRPCDSCVGKPCQEACPVNALSGQVYDIPTCKSHLSRPEGVSCMTEGCAVRLSCPISQNYARLPEQSAFHMRNFLG